MGGGVILWFPAAAGDNIIITLDISIKSKAKVYSFVIERRRLWVCCLSDVKL